MHLHQPTPTGLPTTRQLRWPLLGNTIGRGVRRLRASSPRRRPYLRTTVVALVVGVAATTVATLPTSAHANPSCNASNGALYCGNDAPTNIYSAPAISSSVVDTLESNPSSFKCYVYGEQHSGGNNVWYYTNGDVTSAWGYVPAAAVWTPTGSDPFAGVDACPDQTSTGGSGQTSTGGSGQTSTGGSSQGNTGGSSQGNTGGSSQGNTGGSSQGNTGGASGQPAGSGNQPGGTNSQAPPCVEAPKVTKYLSDAWFSYVKLTWAPEFCHNGAGWRTSGDPVLSQMGSGRVMGVGVNLEAASRSANQVDYKGQTEYCLPFGGGYHGISFTGSICNTMANGHISASIDSNGQVVYQFPDWPTTRLGWPAHYDFWADKPQ